MNSNRWFGGYAGGIGGALNAGQIRNCLNIGNVLWNGEGTPSTSTTACGRYYWICA